MEQGDVSRQKAEGRRQKAKGTRDNLANAAKLNLLPFAFCLAGE
jgi:hypothetical protein